MPRWEEPEMLDKIEVHSCSWGARLWGKVSLHGLMVKEGTLQLMTDGVRPE